MHKIEINERRKFRAEPRTLWRILADTDRLNREVGLPAVEYGAAEEDASTGFALPAQGRINGLLPLRWSEAPFEWEEGRFYRVERRYTRGPMRRMEMVVRLHPAGEETEVEIAAEITAAARAVSPMVRFAAQRLVERIFAVVERHLLGAPAAGRKKVRNDKLRQLGERLRRLPVNTKLLQRLLEHLRTAPDEEVVRMRPFELADRWNFDRRSLLTLFLHAASEGLLTLEYAILCPYCRKPSAEKTRLADAAGKHHCDFCGIEYEGVLEDNVEVRFSVHPTVRRAEAKVYCIGGPLNSPHVIAQVRMPPEGSARLHLAEGSEPLRLRVLRRNLLLPIEREAKAEPKAIVELTFSPAGFDRKKAVLPQSPCAVQIRSTAADAAVVAVERLDYEKSAATAREMLLRPEFHHLFASNLLAPGETIRIQRLAILFSDLKDSTALYERVGDATAYTRVRDHFHVMESEIQAHDGTVVKTIGDAVMAVFASPHNAVRCGLEIQRKIDHLNRNAFFPQPIVLKLGIHVGPVLAIHANGRLDYFGRHVNLAARIQKESCGGDVVISAQLFDELRIRDFCSEQIARVESMKARLKGIENKVVLVRMWPQCEAD